MLVDKAQILVLGDLAVIANVMLATMSAESCKSVCELTPPAGTFDMMEGLGNRDG